MVRYNAYDPFARIYNRYWSTHATGAYPILDHLVLRHLPHASAVLDLCCGTGQLGAMLADDGYATTGVDGSDAMIEIARRNAPGVEFVVQDAREPLPSGEFSAVVSTFNSLNHLMTLADLTQVFRNVGEVLREDGYFVFDLNMAKAYKTRWHGTFSYVEDDHVCIVRSSKDDGQRIGRTELTIFEPEGAAWKRSDLTLSQRWYAEIDVRDGLRDAGFEAVETFNADEPIAEGCPPFPGRMYFVGRCRR